MDVTFPLQGPPPIRVVDTLAVPQLRLQPDRPIEAPLNCAEPMQRPWFCEPQCDPNAPPPWWWLEKWAWQAVARQVEVCPEVEQPAPVEQGIDGPPDVLATCQPHQSIGLVEKDLPKPEVPAPAPQATIVNYGYVSNLGSLMDVFC